MEKLVFCIKNSPTTAAYQAQAMLYQARGYEYPVFYHHYPTEKMEEVRCLKLRL
jgi:hypothetical protein